MRNFLVVASLSIVACSSGGSPSGAADDAGDSSVVDSSVGDATNGDVFGDASDAAESSATCDVAWESGGACVAAACVEATCRTTPLADGTPIADSNPHDTQVYTFVDLASKTWAVA